MSQNSKAHSKNDENSNEDHARRNSTNRTLQQGSTDYATASNIMIAVSIVIHNLINPRTRHPQEQERCSEKGHNSTIVECQVSGYRKIFPSPASEDL